MSQKMQNVENNPVLKFVGSGHLVQMYGNLGSGKSKSAFNLVNRKPVHPGTNCHQDEQTGRKS